MERPFVVSICSSLRITMICVLLLDWKQLEKCILHQGSWGGAVMRALASHQCVPGSIPGPGVICGLSLLLVLALAPRVFSGFSGFPSASKINISKFQFDQEFEGHGFVSRTLLFATLVKQSQFIFYLSIYL